MTSTHASVRCSILVFTDIHPLARFALLFQICGLHEAVAFVHRTSCTRWMWLDSCGASLQNFRRRENCGRLSCHAHSKMFDGRPAADALLLFIVKRRLSSVLPAHESPRLGNGLTFILPCDRFKWSSILRLTSGFHAQRGQLPREREREKRILDASSSTGEFTFVFPATLRPRRIFMSHNVGKTCTPQVQGCLSFQTFPSPACANVTGICLICVCVRACTHSRMQA